MSGNLLFLADLSWHPPPLNRQSLLRNLKVFCWQSLTNIKIKDINIKILCFFIHAFPHMFFDPKKMPKKWQFIFIYDNYINFIYTWDNFDQPIKVTPGIIKVTPSAIKVTPFDGVTLIGLSFRISSKKLTVTYRKVELKANYHIVLHSVAGGLCNVAYFQNFWKTSKIDQSYPISQY